MMSDNNCCEDSTRCDDSFKRDGDVVAIPSEEFHHATEVLGVQDMVVPQRQHQSGAVATRITTSVVNNTNSSSNSKRLLKHLTTRDWVLWKLAGLFVIVSLMPFLLVPIELPLWRSNDRTYDDMWLGAADLTTSESFHYFLKENSMAVVHFYDATNTSLRTRSWLQCKVHTPIFRFPMIGVGQVNCATDDHNIPCPQRDKWQFYQGGVKKLFKLPCVKSTFHSRITLNNLSLASK